MKADLHREAVFTRHLSGWGAPGVLALVHQLATQTHTAENLPALSFPLATNEGEPSPKKSSSRKREHAAGATAK